MGVLGAVARANLQYVVTSVTPKPQQLATQQQRFLTSLSTFCSALAHLALHPMDEPTTAPALF